MKTWKAKHRKRKRTAIAPSLSSRDLQRLRLINRYAARSDCPRAVKERIYSLKDLLMRAYGREVGLVLQHWTTGYSDWGDDRYIRDCCHHYHILKCVRLDDAVMHRPTGHFKFVNEETEYYKVSVGYDEMRRQCTTTIEGRKADKIHVLPDRQTTERAYIQLIKRHRIVLRRIAAAEPGPQPAVRAGNYESEYVRAIDEWRWRQRSEMLPLSDFRCHWCNRTKPGVEKNNIGSGHSICNSCLPKVKSLANA